MFLETSENEHTTPNLGDTGKTVLRKKFIALQPTSISKKNLK